jgi:hypothetical protein
VLEQLDPVVRVALAQLTDFLFRDIPNTPPIGPGSNRNIRSGAVHVFKHLKHHGHRWDPESVRRWALEHGWSEPDAQELSAYADGVQDGVRYHTQGDAFGFRAYFYWVEEAAERSPAPIAPENARTRYWYFEVACGDYDYLYDAGWATFPGRMAAYCPHRLVMFRISRYELPPELPERTQAWVAGFLAGSVPRPPDVAWDADGKEQLDVLQKWDAIAEQYRRTGWWPDAKDLDAFYEGQRDLPAAPPQFDPALRYPREWAGQRKKPVPPE